MAYESNDKMVSHPSHYKFGNFEVIDVVDAVTEELSGYECNYTAQALQYLMRWHRKNGDQDLEKAIWFIQRILDKHKEESEEKHADFDEWLAEKRLKDELAPKLNKPSIDDEPEKLELRKNAAGVYIPKDPEKEVRSCKNCDYGYIYNLKDCTYGPCAGYAGNHDASVGSKCIGWKLKEGEES